MIKKLQPLEINTNPEFELIFNNYPNPVKNKLFALRALIIEVANQIEGLTKLEETLKWGEPSFHTKNGSTIRIDWKKSKPNQYAMYFQCTSRLVPTFKMIYNNTFRFEGSRALIFQIENDIPKDELKKCIKIALTYHKVKHLPALGM